MNKLTARAHLAEVLRLVVERLPEAMPELDIKTIQKRDRREPHHNDKDKLEHQLHLVFMRRFEHQKHLLATRLPVMLGEHKTVIDYTFLVDDNIDEDAERAIILEIILQGAKDGIDLFSELISLDVDWSKANTRAADWASKYVGDLIKGIDQTTLDSVRQAVTTYINTPGMTIGDLVNNLPFDDQRAWRIAITETTRAYAEGQQEAGRQLKEDFPDVRVIKKWFDNEDSLVCDLCRQNADAGEIDIDDAFPSGDDIPPCHVGDRCWVSYETRING